MNWLKHIGLSILVVLLQVLLFDELHLLGLCHPFVYMWVLLLLPIELPRWVQMLAGVALGAVMDMSSHSPGVHMAACVMVAYVRPLMVSGYVQDIQRMKGAITIDSIGPGSYIRLLASMVIIHHSVVFMLEAFTFARFGYTLLQIVVSSVVSFLFVLLLEYVRKSA